MESIQISKRIELQKQVNVKHQLLLGISIATGGSASAPPVSNGWWSVDGGRWMVVGG